MEAAAGFGINYGLGKIIPKVKPSQSSEPKEIVKDIAKKSGSIVMIGGMIYYAPQATIYMAWKLPLTAVKTTVELAGNSLMIAYDTCRLTYCLSKLAMYQIIKINEEHYAVPCKPFDEEIIESTNLADSLKCFSVVDDSEPWLEDWVILESENNVENVEKQNDDNIPLGESILIADEQKVEQKEEQKEMLEKEKL